MFLPVVLGLYWVFPHRAQNVLLLLASYIFYGAWDYRFLALLALSTLIDYSVGLWLDHETDEGRRKLLLGVSVAGQIGLLAFFKYYGFFVESAAELLEGMGFQPHLPTLRILLPVGISFYTFQTLSYTIDIYRGLLKPTKSLLNFGVFVAFFPHLVAGPIFRARSLLPQIENPRPLPSSYEWRSGAFLILLGLFKKVAIADAVAPIVTRAFAAGEDAGTATLLIGMYAFAVQIYGDFSGYTDIARGVSRLFSIHVIRNFEQPYLARNITEFWRTWHISLSSWLRDYLYVPLGGNRGGPYKTYRNLLITMLLGGLWHGASWTFVAWGGIHGILLAVHRATGAAAREPGPVGRKDILAIAGTFHLVALAWIFFRAESFAQALSYIRGLIVLDFVPARPSDVVLVALAMGMMFFIDVAQRRAGEHAVVLRWHPVARGLAYATLTLAVVVWSGTQARQFIYFQF